MKTFEFVRVIEGGATFRETVVGDYFVESSCGNWEIYKEIPDLNVDDERVAVVPCWGLHYLREVQA